MERQLRGWLRYCTYFGVYVGAYEDTSDRTTHAIICNSGNFAFDSIRHHTKRARWCRRAAARSTQLWQRFYLCLLTLVLGLVYMHGLWTRATMPGISWVAATLLYSLHVLTVLLMVLEAWRKQPQHDLFLQLLDQIEVALRLRLQHDVQGAELFNQLRRLIAYLLVISLLGFALFALSTRVMQCRGIWDVDCARMHTPKRLLGIMEIVKMCKLKPSVILS